MSYNPHDTIAAIASAAGGAARGIVRISGPATAEIIDKCFVAEGSEDFAAAHLPTAFAGTLAFQSSEAVTDLPCDLYYWPTAKSYTREPVAELHTLGSPPLLEALLAAICSAGARLAEPGEYTLRAFLSGRIDLTQAEAVLGIIDAQRTDQLDTALEQLAGNLAQPLQKLRDDLLMVLAELEAGLDFVEEDISFISAADLVVRLRSAAALVESVASQMSERLTSDTSAQVVLSGLPNAGKSSLFNALVQRFGQPTSQHKSAIVSNQPGTTRDYLSARIRVGSSTWELVDTAGIEDTVGPEAADASVSSISTSAQELAEKQRKRALVRIHCVESIASHSALEVSPADVLAITKCDLARFTPPKGAIATSSYTGEGLVELCDAVAARLSSTEAATLGHCVAATAGRCRDSIRLAATALARAQDLATSSAGDELVAAEVRVALAELGRVVGVVYTDDLLDRIFSTFCIGK